MLSGVKVIPSCCAFESCIPGGMMISTAPAGRTKALVDDVVDWEEDAVELADFVVEEPGDEDVVLEELVVVTLEVLLEVAEPLALLEVYTLELVVGDEEGVVLFVDKLVTD
jgi:hypothetical protein